MRCPALPAPHQVRPSNCVHESGTHAKAAVRRQVPQNAARGRQNMQLSCVRGQRTIAAAQVACSSCLQATVPESTFLCTQPQPLLLACDAWPHSRDRQRHKCVQHEVCVHSPAVNQSATRRWVALHVGRQSGIIACGWGTAPASPQLPSQAGRQLSACRKLLTRNSHSSAISALS